tara:strand:- start:1825 stop:2676 length:852 start_codon:yes stop_codon:yes gene_type:complete
MIIWLASYPKSGNTWIRSLLSGYFFSKDGNFNFELLKNIKQFSSKDFLSKNNENLNLQTRISKNWIPYQKFINKDKKIHFLKTHNAMCTINGNKFTDKFNTAAAIYIVRDPRNIITSLSHHYEISHEEAFTFLTNKRKIIFPLGSKNENGDPDDFNALGDWASHYNSWKNINFCPIKIVKYEDILLDVESTFISILNFLSKFTEVKLDHEKITNTINTTSFKKLSDMEKKQGFYESVSSEKTKKKINFFNLGKENDWKKLLDKKISNKIKYIFKNEMSELNYF